MRIPPRTQDRMAFALLMLALVFLYIIAISGRADAAVPDGVPPALAHEFIDPIQPAALEPATYVPVARTVDGKTTIPVAIPVTHADCLPSPEGVACTYTTGTVVTEVVVWHPVSTADDWRPLLAVYFPADQIETAVRVMKCESGGDPYAQNSRSTAGGLFQFLDSTWRATGYGGYPKYDPEANIAAAAAWLGVHDYASWWWASQWECY